MGLWDLSIFGDSRMDIKWALQEYHIKVLALQHWCSRIRAKINRFQDITFEHIYRQHNSFAGALSKEAHGETKGVVIWEEMIENTCVGQGRVNLYDSY